MSVQLISDQGVIGGAASGFGPRTPWHAGALAALKRLRLVRKARLIWRRHGRKTRDYLELTRLDERLIYDLGIDPLDLRDALQNQSAPSILLEPMRRQFDFDAHNHHRKSRRPFGRATG
jgi:uncharacterized protein YjiS (DUF1127 family)